MSADAMEANARKVSGLITLTMEDLQEQ
jgi:hypothetical protein